MAQADSPRSDPPHWYRMCMVCREREKKSDLLRIVASRREDRDFSLAFDEECCMKGRGVYVHKNIICVSKLYEMRKRLSKALRLEGLKLDEQGLLRLQDALLGKV